MLHLISYKLLSVKWNHWLQSLQHLGFFQQCQVVDSIHSIISLDEFPLPCSLKTFTQHNAAATTVFHSMESCIKAKNLTYPFTSVCSNFLHLFAMLPTTLAAKFKGKFY